MILGHFQFTDPLVWPMAILISDQEGAAISELSGRVAAKQNIKRESGGTYGHGAAQVAERKIGFTKLTAMKVWYSVEKSGMKINQDDVVIDSIVVVNATVHCGEATPKFSSLLPDKGST